MSGRGSYRKTASSAGQDLRMPILGGTRFPTDDSKSFAKKQLKASQKVSEVGPTPSPKQLRPKGPSLKLGAAMSDDPLIQYLKEAAVLEDNLTDMPTGKEEVEVASECPMPKGDLHSQPARDKSQLGELFDNPSKEAKYLARMHPPTSGSVDRVLKRH